MTPAPDLLPALRAGDRAAWDEAFPLLYPAALAGARHPLASLTPSECEDIAIEALTLLLPKIDTVGSFAELRPLVLTIAARKAISLRRHQGAEKRGGGALSSLETMQEEALFEPTEEIVQRLSPGDLLELGQLLHLALGDLEPKTAGLVRDFLLHRLSYRELTEKYAMPLGSIGITLQRGLEKIRLGLDKKPHLRKELAAFLR